jgi:FAD/FMN-containing dehydrogenase/Fe-S oxidoreductase
MSIDEKTQPTEWTAGPLTAAALTGKARIGDSALAQRLNRELEGDVLFDRFSRGRYATDASIYQMEPMGVIVPRTARDVSRAMAIAADEGIPITARGGGTSQCGQTVNHSLVMDLSKHLNKLVSVDASAGIAEVEPGIVLDDLNRALKPHGLWFPVDVSTSSRATIGGMAGNNSCGSRSIRYGTMRDNVLAIDAVLADGAEMHFGAITAAEAAQLQGRTGDMVRQLMALGAAESDEIRARFPDLMRRVGGYNIDALLPGNNINLSHLLVGSEGTLAHSQKLRLKLSPLATNKTLGVCHFPSFYQAMDAAQHLVKLNPVAVELVDDTMIALARDIPMFKATVDRFVEGQPAALLLVEFAEVDANESLSKLRDLVSLMADLGFPGAVVEAIDPSFQSAIWEVRKQGLNIMMSMKSAGKPVSFVEDCAVRLEDLADYTDRLTQVFQKYNTTGTWYAHASVGTLHVRPVLNMKEELGATQMRAIAEEAFELVRAYKGSHSGEHGDGIVRSEFHADMFGQRMANNFKTVKTLMDPSSLFNPGKIVDPPKMDDRSLFRFKPDYQTADIDTVFDWTPWGDFSGAIEMCNNNGACRKSIGGVMCPSFRVTGDERDLTRGRANTLRLAMSGQLGENALTAPEMTETMSLCVGCKGCKRECPTSVDMAKFKVEMAHQKARRHGLSLRDRVVAELPRYARAASRFSFLSNWLQDLPWVRRVLGFADDRKLPAWAATAFEPSQPAIGPEDGPGVVLLADTFNRHFEPENLEAAVDVLVAAGYRVHLPVPGDNAARPLCCGRTYLSAGLVDRAKAEMSRTKAALKPYLDQGMPIIGLEPSCLLSMRDEWTALTPGPEAQAFAFSALLFEEFLAREQAAGRLQLDLKPLPQQRALLHGHCHQKAEDVMSSVETVLAMVPELAVETIESSCCGMAGAFGYQAETAEISRKMGELSLAPAVRTADQNSLIVADGTSCRHQIDDLTDRQALHVARVLQMALRPIAH